MDRECLRIYEEFEDVAMFRMYKNVQNNMLVIFRGLLRFYLGKFVSFFGIQLFHKEL